MEFQKQQYLCLIRGEQQSLGPPVQGNIIIIMVPMGSLHQVCAQFVIKLPLHESQNPALLSAQLPERPLAGLALPSTQVKFSLLAKKSFHKVAFFSFLPHLYCFLF